jgi:CelD/BcsL family acetyltransferase involved in cellulose biosynthesis
MIVRMIDPFTDPRWASLVQTHPDAGVFHHPAWLSVLKSVYEYSPFVVALEEGRDLVGGVPFVPIRSLITGRRWVSLPFSDHCAPLFAADESAGRELIAEYLRSQIAEGVPLVEIRWRLRQAGAVEENHDFVLHRLKLGRNPEEVFANFKKTQVQQPIQKAEREGVTIHRCDTLEQFRHFYRLQLLTRRRLGVPAQPLKFFDMLCQKILQSGLGYALLALKGDAAIAGGVFFKYKEALTYKYAASDYRFRDLKGNDAVLWSAIRDACREGLRWVDLGRTEKENEGLRRFKSAWGGVEEPLEYTYLPGRPSKRGGGAFSAIGGRIIRISPTAFCRLTGELLYRHYG